jgi:hypothetical protein
MSEISVLFRYGGIHHPAGEISMVILQYLSRIEAIKAFSRFHGYLIESGQSKSFSVSFNQRSESYGDMLLSVHYADQNMTTEIPGIDWTFVEKLRRSLQIFPYFLILAGYTENGEFQLLTAKDYHLWKSDILVNGKWIKGTPNASVDWNGILEDL